MGQIVRNECSSCRGSGRVLRDQETCSRCDGSGSVDKFFGSDIKVCPGCEGEGRVDPFPRSERCGYCNGKGYTERVYSDAEIRRMKELEDRYG